MRRRVPIRLQLTSSECAAACLAMVLSYLGRATPVAEFLLDRNHAALRRLDRGLRVARRFGRDHVIPMNYAIRAVIRIRLGEVTEAIADATDALEVARYAGNDETQAFLRNVLARPLLWRSGPAAAMATVQESLAVRPLMSLWWRTIVDHGLGEILLSVGDAASCRTLLAARELFDGCGAPWLARRPTRIGPSRPRSSSRIGWWNPRTATTAGSTGSGWTIAAADLARYRTVAAAAFAYHRSRFDPDVGNWPDYRVLADRPAAVPGAPSTPHMNAWCHGAPGVGLARADLLARDPVDAPALRADLELALRFYLASPSGGAGHSLGHGELGNLELLTTAIAAGRADLTAERDRRLAVVLDQLDAGPRCGTPAGVTTPGLLTGLAGIGYGLLRHAFADRVPSVLLLAPPIA